MIYKDFPIIDAHIHMHTSYNFTEGFAADGSNFREEVDNCEKFLDDIFKKTDYHGINLVATGFDSEYSIGKAGNVNLLDTPIGYYLKEKSKQKIYLFGALSRNYHYPEKNTAELYLEQAKFRVAAGCDGFKSLDGRVCTYENVGCKLSDPITDLYYDYLEKNNIPITMHLKGPNQIFDKDSIIYAGEEKHEEYKKIVKDIDDDIAEVLRKFPKLTLICAHFNFDSDNLDKAEKMLTEYENVYFDLTPDIFMYYDFNKVPEKEMRAFFKRNQDKIIFGTDLYLQPYEEDIPVHTNVIREYFESEKSEFLDGFGIKPLPMDDEFLKKIYYENFERVAGAQPKKVDYKLAIEECNHLLSDYRSWLNDRDIDTLTKIKSFFSER